MYFFFNGYGPYRLCCANLCESSVSGTQFPHLCNGRYGRLFLNNLSQHSVSVKLMSQSTFPALNHGWTTHQTQGVILTFIVSLPL